MVPDVGDTCRASSGSDVGAAWRAASEPNGAEDVLVGSLRARVQGERIEWSRDFTLRPLMALAREGERWLFATADGVMASAESFTAPLVRVAGAGDRAVSAGFQSEGVLALRASDGVLWLGANDVLRPALAPADGPIIDAGFVDRRFGVAVVAPGTLLRSIDGGGHFEPVDVGAHAVYTVYPERDGFVLETTGGRMRVGSTGPAIAHAAPPAHFEFDLPRATLHALCESFLADHPLAHAWMLANGTPLTQDRVALRDGSDVVVRSARGIEWRQELPENSCSLGPWGSELLAYCDDGHEARIFVASGTRDWTLLRRLQSGQRLLPSSDGVALVALGRCDEEVESEDGTSLCWFDGTSWREHSFVGRVRVFSAHGDALLYSHEEGGCEGTGSQGVHLVHAGDEGEGVPLVLTDRSACLEQASFTPGGSITGVAWRGDEALLALGAAEGAPLVLRPLPQGARQVAFADEVHGVAAGRDLAHVWVTSDGGRSWSSLDTLVDGDASSIRLEDPLPEEPARSSRTTLPTEPFERPALWCIESVCSVRGRAIFAALPAEATPGWTSSRALAAPRAPTVREVPITEWGPRQDGFDAGYWHCERREAPTPRATQTSQASMQARYYGSDGWVEFGLLGAGTDATPRRVVLHWGGVDERGRFRSVARPALLPPVSALQGASSQSEWMPRVVTRGLLVLERCARAGETRRCDVVVATRNGTPRVLGANGELLSASEPAASPVVVRDALALPDGGAALRLGPSFDGAEGTRLDMVLRLDARGVLVARRGFAWPRGVARMLARRGGEPGIAAAFPPLGRELIFYGLDPMDQGQRFALLPAGSLRTCDVLPGAGVALASEYGYAPLLMFGAATRTPQMPYNARASLEVDARGGVCLRGVSFWSTDPEGPVERDFLQSVGGAPMLRASADGTLAGVVVSADEGSATIECRRQ